MHGAARQFKRRGRYIWTRLAAALRSRGNDVSTPALDYALWESAVLGPDADAMGEHHRTLTLAY